MKSIIKFIIFIFLLVIFGCAVPPRKSTSLAQNVTIPVMVGPVVKLKGKPNEKLGSKYSEFCISVKDEWFSSEDYTKEGSNKIDAELLKIISSQNDKVIVRSNNHNMKVMIKRTFGKAQCPSDQPRAKGSEKRTL